MREHFYVGHSTVVVGATVDVLPAGSSRPSDVVSAGTPPYLLDPHSHMAALQIARLLGVARSTVLAVHVRSGLNRLKALEPREPANRYEHERPGDLLGVDIKKLATERLDPQKAVLPKKLRLRSEAFPQLWVTRQRLLLSPPKETMTSQLETMPLGHLDAAALSTIRKSISIGPLKLTFGIDTDAKEIRVDASVLGMHLGGGTLSTRKTKVSIGGSVASYKVQAKITADFSKSTLSYDVTIHLPLVGDKSHSGGFHW